MLTAEPLRRCNKLRNNQQSVFVEAEMLFLFSHLPAATIEKNTVKGEKNLAISEIVCTFAKSF